MAKNNLIRFDWALKRLLRNKADYTILEGFLSVVLQEEIRIVNISESESNQEEPDSKFNRVDILVENSSGELVIVELQNTYEVDYFLRMLYGVSKAVTEHIKKGDRYDKVRKIYHINIIYFKIGEGEDYVYHGVTEFRGIHCNDVLCLTEKQKEFFAKEQVKDLFPEYYILNVSEFNNYAKDSLDEWMYYLKNNSIPQSFTARGLAEVRKQLQYDSLSEAEKRSYDSHLDQWRYEQNVIEDSFDLGKFEGLEEGKVIGMEEGKAIGMEEGEAKERKKMVINSHRAELSVETIATITGLTTEEVRNIINHATNCL
jgi:predicted transposase/invertase (TIGR01784 family)